MIIKDEQIGGGIAGMKEFEMAWQEYFKDKLNPKNDEEEKKELEEFHYWYNHIRKQSDTGKTPAEMYKEIYGKDPPENPIEQSRIMNFGWDEDYDKEEINLLARCCPECNGWGLIVTEDVNVYECDICGAIWKRLKPLNDGKGNMINIPEKLKKLIKEGGGFEAEAKKGEVKLRGK